jgi:hypothetical protein
MNKELIKSGLQVLGILVAVVVFSSSLIAQDVEITDEELTIYATGMNKVDSIKSVVSAQYVQMIKDEVVLKGRFNKMKKAIGDDAKLDEIEATPEEIAAYNKIQESYTTMKSDLNATSTEIIKGDIGANIYNKVKKALKTDAELKTKYESIVDSLTPKEGADGDA